MGPTSGRPWRVQVRTRWGRGTTGVSLLGLRVLGGDSVSTVGDGTGRTENQGKCRVRVRGPGKSRGGLRGLGPTSCRGCGLEVYEENREQTKRVSSQGVPTTGTPSTPSPTPLEYVLYLGGGRPSTLSLYLTPLLVDRGVLQLSFSHCTSSATSVLDTGRSTLRPIPPQGPGVLDSFPRTPILTQSGSWSLGRSPAHAGSVTLGPERNQDGKSRATQGESGLGPRRDSTSEGCVCHRLGYTRSL